MNIGKLLYQDIPKYLYDLRYLRSISTVHSRGLIFKLVTGNWITKYRARSFNEKEPEMLDWVDGNLRDGDVFFDVGANVGIYSIYAALRNPKAKIYAFEPEYDNLAQLKLNIITNHLINNIIPFSLALDDKKGISFLHIQDITSGSALHTVSNSVLSETRTGHRVVWKEGVACMTLDEFCSLSGAKPNMIKIDVDGNEMNILLGGEHTFRDTDLRTIYIEVDTKQSGCEEILASYGYAQINKTNDIQVWKKIPTKNAESSL